MAVTVAALPVTVVLVMAQTEDKEALKEALGPVALAAQVAPEGLQAPTVEVLLRQVKFSTAEQVAQVLLAAMVARVVVVTMAVVAVAAQEQPAAVVAVVLDRCWLQALHQPLQPGRRGFKPAAQVILTILAPLVMVPEAAPKRAMDMPASLSSSGPNPRPVGAYGLVMWEA